MKVITNDSQTLQSMFEGQLSIFGGVSEDRNYTDGKKKEKDIREYGKGSC